jgi:hypothetical protein
MKLSLGRPPVVDYLRTRVGLLSQIAFLTIGKATITETGMPDRMLSCSPARMFCTAGNHPAVIPDALSTLTTERCLDQFNIFLDLRLRPAQIHLDISEALQ